MQKQYDVIILGGGLAGLTLAMELKIKRPETSILVSEMRPGKAPESAHKVGESTVELGTYYLREVLDLKDYLDEHHLPKHGLRFYFSPQHKSDITKRVEFGPKKRLTVPSHQIDRGLFENDMMDMIQEKGIDLILGGKVNDVQMNDDLHDVTITKDGKDQIVHCKWVVDSTGRAGFLKRKLGLKKDFEHNVSAAWFRVKGEIDVDQWSDNEQWSGFLEKGLRRLGTIHLMDKGYWVWLIPLSTGNTSIGIVADESIHPFSTYNTKEKALDWLENNEPQLARELQSKREDILDFRVIRKYALHAEKLFSQERWAVTGEASMFLDPFYSPGTDFIAMNNALISDLISKDLNGRSIHLHVEVFEKTLFSLFDNWIPIYQNKYPIWGNTQTMVMKIFWDWAVYWAVPTLLYTNNGFTNILVLRDLFSSEDCAGQKFGRLNHQVQQLFRDFANYDDNPFESLYVDPIEVKHLEKFHKGMEVQHSTQQLVEKVEENVSELEDVAADIFRLMCNKIYGTPMNIEVDLYNMKLDKKPTIDAASNGVSSIDELKSEYESVWLYN